MWGREAIAEGEVFDPTPANVESRTVRYTLNKRDRGRTLAERKPW